MTKTSKQKKGGGWAKKKKAPTRGDPWGNIREIVTEQPHPQKRTKTHRSRHQAAALYHNTKEKTSRAG